MKYLIVIVLFLFGCSTPTYMYHQPIGEDVAYLSNQSLRENYILWEKYTVTWIDEKKINYRKPFFQPFKNLDTNIISPGDHLLLVEGSFNHWDGVCPCISFAKVSFTAAANHEYEVSGEVKNGKMFFWVVDKENGNIVSEKVASSYEKKPYKEPIFIYY